jgi:hypothetical protein
MLGTSTSETTSTSEEEADQDRPRACWPATCQARALAAAESRLQDGSDALDSEAPPRPSLSARARKGTARETLAKHSPRQRAAPKDAPPRLCAGGRPAGGRRAAAGLRRRRNQRNEYLTTSRRRLLFIAHFFSACLGRPLHCGRAAWCFASADHEQGSCSILRRHVSQTWAFLARKVPHSKQL